MLYIWAVPGHKSNRYLYQNNMIIVMYHVSVTAYLYFVLFSFSFEETDLSPNVTPRKPLHRNSLRLSTQSHDLTPGNPRLGRTSLRYVKAILHTHTLDNSLRNKCSHKYLSENGLFQILLSTKLLGGAVYCNDACLKPKNDACSLKIGTNF